MPGIAFVYITVFRLPPWRVAIFQQNSLKQQQLPLLHDLFATSSALFGQLQPNKQTLSVTRQTPDSDYRAR